MSKNPWQKLDQNIDKQLEILSAINDKTPFEDVVKKVIVARSVYKLGTLRLKKAGLQIIAYQLGNPKELKELLP